MKNNIRLNLLLVFFATSLLFSCSSKNSNIDFDFTNLTKSKKVKINNKENKNKKINLENISKAKKIISKEFSPLSDVRSSKNYRTKIVSNLLDRFWNEYNNKRVTLYDY